MVCENCGKVHNGSYASGRFCSSFCSHSYSAISNNSSRVTNIKLASASQPRPDPPRTKFNKVETFWYEFLRDNYPLLRIDRQAKILNPDIENNNHFYRLDLLVEMELDIEIEGYHPSDKGRLNSDRRDEFLKSIGITTVRVKYSNPSRNYDRVTSQIISLMELHFPGMRG